MRIAVSRTDSASATSSAPIVRGGASRTTSSPAVSTSRPRSRQASTTSAARAATTAPRRRPRPRTERTPGSGKPRDELGSPLDDVLQQLVVDRVDDSARRRADDGVAAERRAVVTGRECPGRSIGDEQGADRKPVREALGESHEIRAVRRVPRTRRRIRRPTPVWISSRQSSVSGSSAAAATNSAVERMDAAFAEDGLEQHEPDVGGRSCAERVHVVRRHEPHPRHERRECLRASRAVRSRRAHRASVRESFLRARRRRASRLPCVRT